MSKLDELIAELCPDGVDVYTVGDICDLITDYTAAGSFADIARNVSYITDGKGFAQLIRTTDLKSRFENDDKFVYVNKHAYEYLWRVHLDVDSIVMPNVGNCGEVYYVTKDALPYAYNVLGPNAILVRSTKADLKYLYYLFCNKEFQIQLSKITSNTGQTKFNKTNFKQLKLPVPPIEIQREIVNILDCFTSYQNELAAELAARKKQYEYYRDDLFTFSENTPDVKWVKMSAIADIKRGIRVVKKDLNLTEGYPVFQNCLTPLGYYNEANFPAETAFVIGAGAAGEIGYSKGMFWAADDCYCLVCSESIIPRYAYYWLLKNQNYLFSRVRKASVPRLARNFIEDLLTPVPLLAEQQRIVDILDRFDKLCNDISQGLPAEIEMRRKQYEYYRDKLLTFKEKEV